LEWTDSNAVTHWLPGVVVGIILFVAVKRINKPVAIPTILAIAAIVFYVVAIALNVSLTQLEAGNWVLGTVPSDTLWQFPLSGEIVAQVNWSVLISELPRLAPIPIVSIFALLLNSGGLELVVKRDIDLNRELVAAGISNLAVGPFAGMTGYQSISLSALNFTVSGGKRLVGIIIALLMAVTIVLGTAVLAYIPKFILGAILIYLGFALLAEWVLEAWNKFPRIDFAIIVVILGVIMVRGFLEGIIVGLVLAIILFAISYSRVSIVKYGLFGSEYNSRFTRAPSEQEILERHSDQLYVLKLQGFIFFGTANSIYDQVRARVNARANSPIRFVLLDFALVTGLDSTGLLSFSRMLQWCQERHIMLGLTGLNGQAREQFVKGGFDEQPGSLQLFSDLDHGVEWCEQQILSATRPHTAGEMNLTNEFTGRGDEFGDLSKFARHLRRQEFAAGEYLFQKGDEAGSIFFVESGQVIAQIESKGKAPVRLETMCSGRVVGELGFFLNIRRTASVIADRNSVVYSLSKPELLEMEQNDPEAANAFHRLVVHLLGERVVHLVRTVNALER
jgi:SulP family sulfate permease